MPLSEKLKRENISLHKSKKSQIEFSISFRYCWKVLDLYGRKEEDYKGIHNLFLDSLKDLPGKKVNKALKEYLKTNEKFPTPAKIRKIAESYDNELTEEQTLFRDMYMKAVTRASEWGYINMANLSVLEAYEKQNGIIKIEKGKTWIDLYDKIYFYDKQPKLEKTA
jgi:hypothetical protein